MLCFDKYEFHVPRIQFHCYKLKVSAISVQPYRGDLIDKPGHAEAAG